MSRENSDDTDSGESIEEIDRDFDRYCNYPEISKPINRFWFSKNSAEDTKTSSSNGVSSLSDYSLFSDGISSVADRNYSASNVKIIPSTRTSTKLSDESSSVESSTTSAEEVNTSRLTFNRIWLFNVICITLAISVCPLVPLNYFSV